MRQIRYASGWPNCHLCQQLSPIRPHRPVVTHTPWMLLDSPRLKSFYHPSVVPRALHTRSRTKPKKDSDAVAGSSSKTKLEGIQRQRAGIEARATDSASHSRWTGVSRPLKSANTKKKRPAGEQDLSEQRTPTKKRGRGSLVAETIQRKAGSTVLRRIRPGVSTAGDRKEPTPKLSRKRSENLEDELHHNDTSPTSQSFFAPPMKSTVEILTSPTADTPGTCLILHTGTRSYLIGRAHEGCQRAIVERGKKLVKLTDLFLTGRVEWEAMGGLLGLMITAADSKSTAKQSSDEQTEKKVENTRVHYEKMMEGQSEEKQREIQADLDRIVQKREKGTQEDTGPFLRLHGPTNLRHAIATCRRFIFRRGVPLRVHEHGMNSEAGDCQPVWSDDSIDVFAVPTWPKNVEQKAGKDVEGDEERGRMLEGVVRDMFNSSWRMDALFETKLANVPMPAAIFYRNPETRKIDRWTGPKPGDVPAADLPDVKVLVRQPWPAAMVKDLPKAQPSPVSLSYIVKGRRQRGKFLPDVAKKLGIPVKQFKVLAANQPVTLEDGTVVEPEQVLEPSRPGRGFAVIDLPSSSYVQSLAERPEWKSDTIMEELSTIFWLLGPGVANSPQLAAFIHARPDIRHVISSKEHTSNYFGLPSAASLELRLAKINPLNFPVLEFSNRRKALPSELSQCIIAHPGQELELEPKSVWDESGMLTNLNTSIVIENMPKVIKAMAQEAGRKLETPGVKQILATQNLPGSDAEVITLGTGSSAPSKYRNVSATLLRVPGHGTYLFDAGENTIGTLTRMFNPEELEEILKDLRMIWISHLHADHHLGTASVIKAWHRATQVRNGESNGPHLAEPNAEEVTKDPARYLNRDKLFVVSDTKMLNWLSEYAQVERFGHERIVPVSATPAEAGRPDSTKLCWNEAQLGYATSNQALNEAMKAATGLVDIQTAQVSHCAGAMAVSVTFSDGFKVSYSGDCRPSQRFVEIGKGSTLLIHEATFEDGLMGDAIAKKHSTTSEALKVGLEMEAPCIILTHFSQRYAKLPNINNVDRFRVRFDDADNGADMDEPTNEESKAATEDIESTRPANAERQAGLLEQEQEPRGRFSSRQEKVNVAVAFDYMRVKVKDIGRLKYFDPVLNALADTLEHGGKAAEGRSDSDSGSPKKRKRGTSSGRRKK